MSGGKAGILKEEKYTAEGCTKGKSGDRKQKREKYEKTAPKLKRAASKLKKTAPKLKKAAPKLKRVAAKLAKTAVQLLYPLHCPVCDRIVIPFGEKICLECIPKLKYIAPPRCLKCGKHLGDENREYCHDCSRGTHRYVQGRALYEYQSVRSGIYRLKYGSRREYADFYGEEIARYLMDFICRVQPDALIPIPLHTRRLRRRGYNQAKLLADAIGKYTGIPVCDKMLVRVKNTTPLKRLNPQERQNNLKKAFHMVGNDVKLKTIILIDDIYTTGSTMDEASAVLLSGGVERVYCITLACGAGI